jgi:LPS export ABC transporter protein LptC
LAGFIVMLGLMLWNAKNLTGFKRGALLNMLPANVDMRLGNLTLSETDGDDSMAVKADSAHYFKEEDYFLLTNVAADIGSSGAVYSVAAKSGRYEPKDQRVALTGGVRASDALGRVLTSGRLDLDMDQGTFASSVEFCLEDPDLSLSGQSFVYDTRRGLLEVEGRVLMIVSRPPADQPEAALAPDDRPALDPDDIPALPADPDDIPALP